MAMINFGCGLSTAHGWTNYDASPSLRLQRMPLFGFIAQALIKPRFPDQVIYGDIVKGLPEAAGSADHVYCSHVLEHLSLEECRVALIEVFRILKPGGVFRAVLPDLEADVRNYLADQSADACSAFMRVTCLGYEQRPQGLIGRLRALLGNSQHLWLWDYKGIAAELESAGFIDIRRAAFNDSLHPEFVAVEDRSRWHGCLGFECRKPSDINAANA